MVSSVPVSAPAAPFSSLLSSVLLSVSVLSVLSVIVVVTVTVVALPEAMLNSVKRRCDWSQLVDLEISSNNSILLPLVGPEYSAVSMELSITTLCNLRATTLLETQHFP